MADRIAEYHRLGIDHFIMSGQPHLEEAYWFAEGVFPCSAATACSGEATGIGRATPAPCVEPAGLVG